MYGHVSLPIPQWLAPMAASYSVEVFELIKEFDFKADRVLFQVFNFCTSLALFIVLYSLKYVCRLMYLSFQH